MAEVTTDRHPNRDKQAEKHNLRLGSVTVSQALLYVEPSVLAA